MIKQPSGAERALLLFGSLGPLGHLPASGTATVAIVGVPLYWLIADWPGAVRLIFVVVVSAVAVWVHHVGDRILGEKDSGKLIWDELAGYFVAVAVVPFTWQLAVISFFLERFLDIAKVEPARWIEDHWPGGWGVVGDDLVAGLYTAGVLLVLARVVPSAVGLAP